ncbi:MAG: hypothetical protein ACTS42_00350 [Candidatus Hodgkinia cicadicola]
MFRFNGSGTYITRLKYVNTLSELSWEPSYGRTTRDGHFAQSFVLNL